MAVITTGVFDFSVRSEMSARRSPATKQLETLSQSKRPLSREAFDFEVTTCNLQHCKSTLVGCDLWIKPRLVVISVVALVVCLLLILSRQGLQVLDKITLVLVVKVQVEARVVVINDIRQRGKAAIVEVAGVGHRTQIKCALCVGPEAVQR